MKAALAGLKPEVQIGADTKLAKASAASLKSYITALTAKNYQFRLLAEDKLLQASLARDYAMLLKMNRQVTAGVGLEGQAVMQAQLLTLDAGMEKLDGKISVAHVKVDDQDAERRLALLLVKIRALADRTAEVKLGVSDPRGLQQIAKLQEALAKLGDTVHTIDFKTNAAGIAQAETDLKGLANELTRFTGVQKDAAAGTRMFTGAWANVARFKIPLAGLTSNIFGMGIAWHVAASAVIEFAAVAIPALVGVAAFAAAAVGPVSDIFSQMQNINTVTKATSKSLYPLTGQFQKIADAVRPQVYQIFGDALNVINGRTGEFERLAKGVGGVLDQLAGRASAAILSGGLSKFLKSATSDVAKFGDIFANVFGTVGNLLKAVPGYAPTILGFFDNLTKAMEAISGSKVVTVIAHLGLAFHGAFVYTGILATGIGYLISKGLGLLPGAASKVAYGLEKMGLARAAGAMDKFAMGAGKAAGLPWGVFAAAAIVIGYLGYKVITLKDATQQWFAAMEQGLGALPAGIAGFTRLQQDQVQVASRLTMAQIGVGKATALAAQQAKTGGGVWRGYAYTVNAAKTQVSDYSSAQKTLMNQSNLFESRMGRLAIGFGGLDKAQGLARLSGIKMADMLKYGSAQFAQIVARMSGTVDAMRAMGQRAGVLGSDLNALNIAGSDQVTMMAKLNQAWDTVMGIVSGGQNAFITFQQNMLSVNQAFTQTGGTGRTVTTTFKAAAAAAKAAGASMTGLNAPSLQLRQTWQTLFTSGSSLLDALRNLTALHGTGSFPMLRGAMKDVVAQEAQFGKGSKATRAELVAQASQLSSSIHNWKDLVKWVGNVKNPAEDLNKRLAKLGTNVQNLAGDEQKLSGITSNFLISSFAQAKLAATQFSDKLKTLMDDMANAHTPATKLNTDTLALVESMAKGKVPAKTISDLVLQFGIHIKGAGDTASAKHQAFETLKADFIAGGDSAKKAAAEAKAVATAIFGIPKTHPFTVTGTAKGTWSITQAIQQHKSQPGAFPPGGAQGMFIDRGTTPTADDVLIRASKGELIVPTHMVQGGAVDHLRGKIPGFAAGGPVGFKGTTSGLPQMAGNVQPWYHTFENRVAGAMEAAATAAMIAARSAALAAAMGSGSSIVRYAESFIGKVPYVWGGATPRGWDCSGFVEWVYNHFNIHPPRTAAAQFGWVKRSGPQPGGLAFFAGADGTTSSPGHVGIVVNPNTMVNAYTTGTNTQFNQIHGSSGAIAGYGVPPGGLPQPRGGGGNIGAIGGTMNGAQVANLWKALGGPANAAHNMARIAFAESGDHPGIVQKGQPPGLTGWGLYQITPTSGIRQNGQFGNLLNAANNTRAAIHIFRGAGYSAWSTAPGLGLREGGLIGSPKLMDRGGLIPPGPSMVVNKTGRPEYLSPGGGSSDERVVKALNNVVRLLGEGNDIAAATPGAISYAVGGGMYSSAGGHRVGRPVA